MNVIDCHIHFGQFGDINYTPEILVEKMRNLSVSTWCGMPFFSDQPFDVTSLINNYKQLLILAPTEFKPILAIDPEMIGNISNIQYFNDIQFMAIKIHPYIHHWLPFSAKFEQMLNFVRYKNIPLMIHTGGRALSDAGIFFNVCKSNPDIKFVLCHGRPAEEAIKVMLNSENVYVDTAFMDVEDIKLMISEGLHQRIIFGSDFPANQHFQPEITDIDWYNDRIDELVSHFGKEIFEVFNNNYEHVFKI
ncbi:MAG: amidohydrolase family protein [Bacteroidota bacterium]